MEKFLKLIREKKVPACRQAGFTLIELIMVIVIIVTVAAASVPGFMNMLRRAKFEKTVGEVVMLFEKARTQALASKLDSNQKIPPGGYGVFLDFTTTDPPVAQKAVLFIDDWNEAAGKKVKVDYADTNITNRILPDGIYTAGADTELTTVDLNNLPYIRMIELKGIKLTDSATWAHASGNVATLIFMPPYAETTVVGGGTDLQTLEVIFKLVTENTCRQIIFNRVTTTPQLFKNNCP